MMQNSVSQQLTRRLINLRTLHRPRVSPSGRFSHLLHQTASRLCCRAYASTGPQHDCGRRRFWRLGDHQVRTVLFSGALNQLARPKWTLRMHTMPNCAVREESGRCCRHIKLFPSLGSLQLISPVSRVFLFRGMCLSRSDVRLQCTVEQLCVNDYVSHYMFFFFF